VRIAVDENFDNDILRGVLRRDPNLDIVRVQDVALGGLDDERILAWCAAEGRVLVTHDVNTMVGFAFERIAQGLPMPGLIEVPLSMPVRQAIEELFLIIECSFEGEWEGRVGYLPLR
jgi:hypothetical protein